MSHSQPKKEAFDQLHDAARIKGPTRVIPDGAKPEEVTREQSEAVVAVVRDFQERAGIKDREIARAIGVSSSTVAAALSGAYVGRWQETIIDLDLWLEQELKRQRLPMPTDFVTTRVAEAVMTIAEVTSALKGIGVVYGWAGIGKTTALRAVAAQKPGSVFVSVKTTTASPLGVLQSIGAALGLRDVFNHNQRGLMSRLEAMLAGTPRLLIVDEVHKLCFTKDDRSLHVLRDLYDVTGSPMLWSGTIDLVAYLDRFQAKGREPLAQIRSRICVARDLSDMADGGGGGGGDGGGADALYTIDEIRRVFAKCQMRLAPDAARYLFKLANLPDSGALRTCRNLVVIAVKINAVRGDTLTAAMLQGAHQLLVSRRDYAAVQASLKGEEAARPMARVG
jgi:DNA transposition AAA+ family ATPase